MKSNIPRYSLGELCTMRDLVKQADEAVPTGKWSIIDSSVCDALMNVTDDEDGWTLQLRLDCGWEVCEIDVGYDEANKLWAVITDWHWSFARMPFELRRQDTKPLRFEVLLTRILQGLEAGAMELVKDLTPALKKIEAQEEEAASLLSEAVHKPEGWKQEPMDFTLEPDEMAY